MVLCRDGAAGWTRAKFPGHKRQVASREAGAQGNECRYPEFAAVWVYSGIVTVVCMMGNDEYDDG